MAPQVKSRQRVADHGEVFTNEREVNAMLDLVWDNFITPDKKICATYLEPACGSGNFLVNILERKLQVARKHFSKSRVEWEMSLIRAVSSIYGVELLQDNVEECRGRLYKIILKAYPKKYQDGERYPKMCQSLQYILAQNIIWGDALRYQTLQGEPIVFTHWSLQESGWMYRNFFDFREISKVKEGTGSLFGELASEEVPEPKHYLELTSKSLSGVEE